MRGYHITSLIYAPVDAVSAPVDNHNCVTTVGPTSDPIVDKPNGSATANVDLAATASAALAAVNQLRSNTSPGQFSDIVSWLPLLATVKTMTVASVVSIEDNDGEARDVLPMMRPSASRASETKTETETETETRSNHCKSKQSISSQSDSHI